MSFIKKISCKTKNGFISSILVGLIISNSAWSVNASDDAIILLYHKFSEPAKSTISINRDNFSNHIKELTSGPYNVLPLAQLIRSLEINQALPERTIIITLDEAYESILKNAWPLLKANGLPATLFLTTQPINIGKKGYLSWGQIKKMVKQGLSIGLKAHTQRRLTNLTEKELEREIQTARSLILTNLAVTPVAFAFPYGIASLAVQKVVKANGFKIGFGQHSGVLHRGTQRYYLPRFSLTDTYGDSKRFKTIVNATALPISDLTPSGPVLYSSNNPPNMGFTVLPSVKDLRGLACYHSEFGKIKIHNLGSGRIELRFKEPFSFGRSRINCTIQSKNGRWRWLGMQYYFPK